MTEINLNDSASTTPLAATLDLLRRGRRFVPMGRSELAPGLLLTTGIAVAAYALRRLPGLGAVSPMILAIGVGMLFHNAVGTPAAAKAGVVFSMRRVLRAAIILLGLQLSAQQLAEVGFGGFCLVAVVLVSTFLFTKAAGRVLGVDPRLAELIAAGTSICGASAVIATNTVTEGSDEDVAYAVACVTLFGSVSMFLYPMLGTLLDLDAHRYGLWAGASIHEIAQVVAASFQHGQVAGDFGTISKLSRVMLLAPVVMVLGLGAARRDRQAGAVGGARKKASLPWFVLGFVALVGLNSLGAVPASAKQVLVPATPFLLTIALAGMGLETDFRKLRAEGLRPLLLGALAWLFISGFSLGLGTLLG